MQKSKLDAKSMTPFEVFKLILSICGIMFLFGLTWVFAVLTFVSTNRDVAFGLQFIFAFFNTLQGFWIFFFFVVLNSDTRNSWKELLFHLLKKKGPPTSPSIAFKNKYFIAFETKSSSISTATNGMDTLKHNIHASSNWQAYETCWNWTDSDPDNDQISIVLLFD